MKLKLFTLIALTCTLCSFTKRNKTNDIEWYTSHQKVMKAANLAQQPVLIFFHGSDWCPPCISMSRDIFADTAFINYATDKILFLDVDFPYKKKLTKTQLKHNKNVKKKFGLPDEYREGFPQVVIINANGKLLYQQKGYDGQGATYLITKVNELLTTKKIKP